MVMRPCANLRLFRTESKKQNSCRFLRVDSLGKDPENHYMKSFGKTNAYKLCQPIYSLVIAVVAAQVTLQKIVEHSDDHVGAYTFL